MSFNTNKEIKKTRKPHYCHGCCDIIPIGCRAQNDTGVIENEFYSVYMCYICLDFIKANKQINFYEDGGMHEDDMWEYDEYVLHRVKLNPEHKRVASIMKYRPYLLKEAA